MASSSLPIDSCDNYDVFLSFRGKDTRYNFTSHLYKDLCGSNIKVFIDYEIKRGKEITPFIESVIERAKMSIIVFSKNYAESTFCLDELVKIMECRQLKEQIVLPIFYKIEPSEEIYQEALARHEQTIKQEMLVERWKSAFRKTLELAGEVISENCIEASRIEKITSEVLMNLKELNSLPKGQELMCTSIVGETSEDNFRKIWKCLMNDKISRVGVYGMGGVGKTTIATRINNQLQKIVNPFTHIYWVTFSKESNMYKLQSDIARRINLDLSKEDDEKIRAAMLHKQLMSKKFVLILDDVWKGFNIKDVGIPLSVGGGKLLLTTRKLQVCERMECQPFQVNPLSEREAWNLFVKESKCQIIDSQEWRKLIEAIVRQCGGLPLALVVLARSLRGKKNIGEWRKVLRDLKNPCEGQDSEMEEEVFKPLKVSYDLLPNDKFRRCFLYFSLFPEDYEINRNDLIEYWIGEGLVDQLDSKQDELDEGNAIINELIRSSLLEHIQADSLKMHDMIRDMAHIINQTVGLRFQDPLKEAEWSFDIGSVAVMNYTMSKSCLPNTPSNCPKLRTLLVRDHARKELPSCFFGNMQSLTVLHMHRLELNQHCISNFPDSISNLGNLRVLILFGDMSLKCIPYLGGLVNLRHLKVSRTGLKEIPKGMERLINLRVLNLSRNYNLCGSFISVVLQKLTHLQNLQLEGSRLEMEPEALISLEKLETLRVHFLDFHKLNSYVKSGHWRRLLEYHVYCVDPVHYMRHLPKSSKKAMSLEGSEESGEWKRESGIFIPDDIQMLRLEHWDIRMFASRNRAFVDLQMIEIMTYKGRYLFTPALALQLLHNVKEIDIHFSYELEEIIAIEEEECINQSNYNNYPTIELPKVKKLTLRNLYQLSSIYRGRILCPSLEYIEIHACDKLEKLPFGMEEQNYPTIKLRGFRGFDPVSSSWWDSLKWDNPNAKSVYQLQ